MKLKSVLLCAVLASTFAVSLQATQITATFIRAETPPFSTTQAVPFLMNNAKDIDGNNINDLLFFKFKIPNLANIAHIDGIQLEFTFYDDELDAGESGIFEIAQPGSNILLFAFNNLRGSSAALPFTLLLPLPPEVVTDILPSLADGNLRLRATRQTGDFIVGQPQVFLDVTLVPEPASIATTAGGLLLLAGFLRRRIRPSGAV